MNEEEKKEQIKKIMNQIIELEKKIEELQKQKAYHLRRYYRVVEE